ncbi:glutamate--cysteine ligase [Pseudoclavibacter chungangensis]|uniref:Putative glutamate--cysteine ligase 2 n=1 Tax=Pseudoclavibacter chungangensis TaxID=587635 RepID=A0A7J5BZ07_9MICO|nr:glutamate--cysteine ligase [Pseudoclavibacter chungangensis]KAB1659588.1 glutamate--cysteine ligase [Pseudoclavibacter chungangensis]NYJ67410.1 carboxylate-amine ligase [Pseudoclavibacter chungangensis]
MDFARSRRSTLGVEWELCLVDPDTRELAPAGLAIVEQASNPHVVGEFMRNTIELVTGVHETVPSAVAELRRLRDAILPIARAEGVVPIGPGTHPFSPWRAQELCPSPRYAEVAERSGDWGRQLAIWGVHAHVGVERADKVVPIMHGVLAAYPLIHAIAASSPYWEGHDTRFASHRAMLFQQLPTGGLPPELDDWSTYERVAADYLHTGIVDQLNELRWDVRPAPNLGTVEIRIADGATRLDDLGAVVALCQVIAEATSRRLDAGLGAGRLPSWYVRENKWRASRYGLEAIIIENEAGDERLVTDVLADRLVEWAPIAEELGCAAELASIAALVERSSSADRQRAAASRSNGDLRAVVDHLAEEVHLG